MADHKVPSSAPPAQGAAAGEKVDSFVPPEVKVELEDNTIPIAVAVIVGLLTLLLYFLYTRRRRLGRGETLQAVTRVFTLSCQTS